MKVYLHSQPSFDSATCTDPGNHSRKSLVLFDCLENLFPTQLSVSATQNEESKHEGEAMSEPAQSRQNQTSDCERKTMPNGSKGQGKSLTVSQCSPCGMGGPGLFFWMKNHGSPSKIQYILVRSKVYWLTSALPARGSKIERLSARVIIYPPRTSILLFANSVEWSTYNWSGRSRWCSVYSSPASQSVRSPRLQSPLDLALL